MIRQHPLISHPVGRMSAAARWYLAGITMLMLVLVAVHFAMQVYAQEEAKRLVAGWAKQSGISVGSVRYRMLRGALTIVDLRLEQGKTRVDIPLLFLQGSLSALSGERPKLSAMEIRGAGVQLTAASLKELFAGGAENLPDLFRRFWSSTQRIGIYKTRLDLVPEAGIPFPLKTTGFDISRLESHISSSARDVEGVAHWLDGELRLAVHAALKDGDAVSSGGHFRWSGLNTSVLLENVLGLASTSGSLSGNLVWNRKRDERDVYSVRGEAGVSGLVDDGGEGSLSWSGEVAPGKWKGDAEASSWPMVMFSDQLPQLQKRKLSSGRFDGSFHLAGSMSRWQMDLNGSELRGVRFGDDEAAPGWRVGSMQIESGHLQWPDRKMEAKSIHLKGAEAIFDPGTSEAPGNSWKIETKTIVFEQFTPALYLPSGLLLLPPLEGRGSLAVDGAMQLKLRTAGPGQDLPEEAKSEAWNIAGKGFLSAGGDSRFRLDIEAARAPLVRFRAVMPKMIGDEASGISGGVNLKLQVLAGSAPWEAEGEAKVADAQLQYAGEQWQAETVSIGLERVGAALPEQLIQQIALQGWRYRAALSPLGPPDADDDRGKTEADNSTKRAESWHVRKLSFTDGLVTVGHADAIWADHAEIQVSDLRPGQAATVEAKAGLGDGHVAMNGMVAWESEGMLLQQARVTVRDALPFFMNEWLTVSGAPKIVRGRLYADFSLKREAAGGYAGMGYLRLQNGSLGPTLSRNDPLLSRIGMNSQDVFARLLEGSRIRLQIPLKGPGEIKSVLGNSLLLALKAAIDKKGGGGVGSGGRASGDLLALVRLHEDDSLSQNERTRLRKVLQYLKSNPKAVVELKPRLSTSSEEEGQSERVRYTQRLIEGFLNYRGISRSRIFPVWPMEQHRSSSSSNGIGVVTLP